MIRNVYELRSELEEQYKAFQALAFPTAGEETVSETIKQRLRAVQNYLSVREFALLADVYALVSDYSTYISPSVFEPRSALLHEVRSILDAADALEKLRVQVFLEYVEAFDALRDNAYQFSLIRNTNFMDAWRNEVRALYDELRTMSVPQFANTDDMFVVVANDRLIAFDSGLVALLSAMVSYSLLYSPEHYGSFRELPELKQRIERLQERSILSSEEITAFTDYVDQVESIIKRAYQLYLDNDTDSSA